jgi:hypothetical protein
VCAAVYTASNQHQLEVCTEYGTCENADFIASAELAKMAAVLEECKKEEQHSVIYSFVSKDDKHIAAKCAVW